MASVFRTIAEKRIEDHLLMWGCVHDLREGREDSARTAVQRALERWVTAGLRFERAASGERLFDPAEVINTFIAAGRAGRDDFWESRYVATTRRLVRDLHSDIAPDVAPSPQALKTRRFHVRLERDYELSRFRAGSRVRLRLPRPVEDHALRNLQLSALPLEGAQPSIEPERIEYRLVADGERQVTVAFDAQFDASPRVPAGEPLDAVDRELYLRLADGLVHATPEIVAMSRSPDLSGGDHDAVARRIFDHVLRSIHLGLVQYGDIDRAAPTAHALATGWCDCQLAAALFAALCRLRGIPARIVSGYPLHAASAGHHYWAQAWIEGRGWVPYDFAAWHLGAGGRDDWRGLFVGALDYRMNIEVFPRVFTGVGSVRFPPYWHMIGRTIPGGVELTYEDAATQQLVYRERFFVVQ